jgi:hypothetical protein
VAKSQSCKLRKISTMLAIVLAIAVGISGCGDGSSTQQSLLGGYSSSQNEYVSDAGVVIASPFIPTLFNRADIHLSKIELAPGESPGTDYYRAMLMLHYLVNGSGYSLSAPSALITILCGLPVGVVPPPDMRLSDDEIQLCNQALMAILANWTIISGTSVAGLQETFLQRDGRLTIEEDKYLLRVQRKTLDVLLGSIPWSFSVVYHPWMVAPLYTSW